VSQFTKIIRRFWSSYWHTCSRHHASCIANSNMCSVCMEKSVGN